MLWYTVVFMYNNTICIFRFTITNKKKNNKKKNPWENGTNANFRPSLGPPKFFPWVLPLLVVRQCSKLSSHTISSKSNGPNFKKMTKNLILVRILAHLAQIWATKFFLQVLLLLLVIRYCSKLSSNAIIRETKEPNLRK